MVWVLQSMVILTLPLLISYMYQTDIRRPEATVPVVDIKTSTSASTLLGLFISLSRESCDFYDELSGQTDNAILRNVFINVARRKRALIDELDSQQDVDADGGAVRLGESTLDYHGWARSLRKIYRYGRTQFENDDEQFIGWLEVAERQWLRGCEAMLTRLEPLRLRATLQRHLPRLREMHAEIISLSRI